MQLIYFQPRIHLAASLFLCEEKVCLMLIARSLYIRSLAVLCLALPVLPAFAQ